MGNIVIWGEKFKEMCINLHSSDISIILQAMNIYYNSMKLTNGLTSSFSLKASCLQTLQMC